jgi:cytochrome c peroxidase
LLLHLKLLSNKAILLLFSLTLLIIACGEDPVVDDTSNDLTKFAYEPVAFDIEIPAGFPVLQIPADNQLTEQGIALGRSLFYDPILSVDSTLSCASCHFPDLSFTDGRALSPGVDGEFGTRSSMSLLNIAFNYRGLFWDGRVSTLEQQALLPIEDPIELHHTWPDLVADLQAHETYPKMFREAFGIESKTEITKELAAKAIAQFERILISGGNSQYDKVKYLNTAFFTDEELRGEDLFIDDGGGDTVDAECSHCHNGPLLMGDDFFNNGLDSTVDFSNLLDLGRGGATGVFVDNAKFKAPTLRNIGLTAPYMHDGRFGTLEEVLEHYNSGGHPSPNKDQNIRPLNLTASDKADLLFFLHSLTDTTYMYPELVTNPH